MKIATKHKLIKRKSKTHMLFKKVSSFRLKRQAVLAHIETEPSVPLLQLPPEVFDNILSKVPVWHLNRLRGVGRTMAKRTDEYTMHLVRTHLASQSPTVYERALQTARIFGLNEYTICLQYDIVRWLVQVIDQLTWPLRSAGLGEFYAGAMLSLLRQNYYKPFSPCAMDVHEYVFSLCDHIRRTLSPKTFRFAYLVTLLSLMEVNATFRYIIYRDNLLSYMRAYFQRDECAEKVSSKSNAKFGLIHIVYKLHKSWLGVLHATYPCPRSLQFPEDGPFLLVFMCDLLMFALTKQTRKYNDA